MRGAVVKNQEMDQEVMDERKYVQEVREKNLRDFSHWVKMYDAFMYAIMLAAGWHPVFSKERTVIFTFGEVTFMRRVYKKGKRYRYPVDEKLGLRKNERYSKELLYQIAELAKFMTYRQVPKVIEMMYQVYITKDTVQKAVKMTAELFEEREEYSFYEERQEVEKVKAEAIFVEGDGVMVHAKVGENHWKDLAHFVIHTGSCKVGGSKKRRKLLNKREVIAIRVKDAVRKVVENLTNYYDLESCQVLVTNADGGVGYTPHVFKELAGILKIGHHEHFWDEYHLNDKIKKVFMGKSRELRDLLFEAISTHDKQKARLALDTQESLLEEEDESFSKFSRKLLQNFQYTLPAKMRQLTHKGIGVMESQHVKITNRMKNRKMYWGEVGADTMSRMLIMTSEELRELWFGSWRKEFEKYKDLPENISEFLKPVKEEYSPYRGIVHLAGNQKNFKS